MLNVGDEAQREKNSSQVETQTLRGEEKVASAADYWSSATRSKITFITLTCSKALAVYVTRMAGKVPSFVAFLKTSETHGHNTEHSKASADSQSWTTDVQVGAGSDAGAGLLRWTQRKPTCLQPAGHGNVPGGDHQHHGARQLHAERLHHAQIPAW